MLGKKALITINFAVFIALLALSYISTSPSSLFPRTQANVSHEYPTEITPSDGTFAIWGFIFFFQMAWLIYSITLNIRAEPGDILPVKFFSYYILSSACNISWLFAWARVQFGMSLALVFGVALTLVLSYIHGSAGLYKYLKEFPGKKGKPNLFDVWCTRILVQNGVIFYATWVSIATCLNLVIFLHYNLGMDGSRAATAALGILLCATLLWFIMENFVFQEYTRYVFTEYVVLIVALSGVLKAHWTGGQGNQAFVLAVLIVSAILLVARIALIVAHEIKIGRRTQTTSIMMG